MYEIKGKEALQEFETWNNCCSFLQDLSSLYGCIYTAEARLAKSVWSSAEELVEVLQDAHSNLTNLIATLPCNNIKIWHGGTDGIWGGHWWATSKPIWVACYRCKLFLHLRILLLDVADMFDSTATQVKLHIMGSQTICLLFKTLQLPRILGATNMNLTTHFSASWRLGLAVSSCIHQSACL